MITVHALFTAPDKGAPMESHDHIRVIKNVGLAGDRYALNRGAWSHAKPATSRHVTFIALRAIVQANVGRGGSRGPIFRSMDTRRNVVLAGIDPTELNNLVGKTFVINEVEFFGVEPADPCDRPAKLSGKPGFKESFEGIGGLRASCLSEGVIHRKDELLLVK